MTLRKRSEIVWILVLVITTTGNGVCGSNFVLGVGRFSLFYKQNGAFWCRFMVREKQSNSF